MNAAPEGKGEPVTRLKAMQARNEQPVLPPVSARHIVDWWLEIGPAGDGALTWQEIAAWEQLTGIELEPWEAKTIRSMSAAFVSQRFEARKAGCPAPYSTEQDEQDNVTAAFAALKQYLAHRSDAAK